MAYCTNCGTASTGAYCPQCGTSMAGEKPKRSTGLIVGAAIGGGLLVLGIVGLVLLLGRGGGGPTSPAGGTVSLGSGSAAKVSRKPGHVTGIVLDQRGEPLKLSPDQIMVRVFGNRASDMEEVTGFAPVKADGRFEMKVPDGNYAVTGFAKVQFEGTEFWLSLEPEGGKALQESKQGIAKEMRLKLSGLIPGSDAGNPYSYYGGHVRMQYQGHTLPESARVTFTLTPTSPLADGSQGQPLTFTVTGTELRSNAPLVDIPLARYRITGEVTFADGTKKAALISQATGNPATEQEFTFRPNSVGEGIEGVFLWMMGEQ